MRAHDVMTTGVVTVTPETPVHDVAQILLDRRISAAPVVDAEGCLVGIISEGDLIRRPEMDTEPSRSWWLRYISQTEELAEEFAKTHGNKAEDVMTSGVITVEPETPLAQIAKVLEERHIKRVPVVVEVGLVGLVGRADLLRGLASAKKTEPPAASLGNRAIREQILDMLDKADWARAKYLTVAVDDGIVHLWGLVRTEAELKAIRIACEGVAGVKAVADHTDRFRFEMFE